MESWKLVLEKSLGSLLLTSIAILITTLRWIDWLTLTHKLFMKIHLLLIYKRDLVRKFVRENFDSHK
jgi:hypothetical protein